MLLRISPVYRVKIDYNFNMKVRIYSIIRTFVPINVCTQHGKQKDETFYVSWSLFPFLDIYFWWKCKLSSLNSCHMKLLNNSASHSSVSTENNSWKYIWHTVYCDKFRDVEFKHHIPTRFSVKQTQTTRFFYLHTVFSPVQNTYIHTYIFTTKSCRYHLLHMFNAAKQTKTFDTIKTQLFAIIILLQQLS